MLRMANERLAPAQARPLIHCLFGLRAPPWSGIISSVGAGFVISFVLLFAGARMVSGLGPVLLAQPLLWALATTALFLVNVVPGMVRALRTRVYVDEAGLRIDQHGVRAYWPFGLIGEARVGHSFKYGAETLHIADATGRPVVEAPLFGKAAGREGQTVRDALAQRRSPAGRRLSGPAERLRRMGRGMTEWVSALQAESKTLRRSDYRSETLTPELLLSVARGLEYDPDDRAAAACVLLAGGDPTIATEVLSMLCASSPPMLVCLCDLPGGKRPEGQEALVREASEWLDGPDREEWERLRG